MLFTMFNRLALAAGFIPSGFVKIMGERFTALPINHPMGHYLEALHYTGYYYTFIGIMQVTAAILLLIPRTATLGAIIYFPIILNICLLSLAVRFDGSLLTSPLMVIANLYLLCWDYDKLKRILPHKKNKPLYTKLKGADTKFPFIFFGGVLATVIIVGYTVTHMYSIMPHNHMKDCLKQFKGTNRTEAGYNFCDCVHNQGGVLDKCMEEYKKAPDDR